MSGGADLEEFLTQEARDLWHAQGKEDLSPEDWPEEIELIRRTLRRVYDRGRVDGRNAAPDRLIRFFMGEDPC